MEINIKPTLKQKKAWKIMLLDNHIDFLLFGGGAGGGKVVASGDYVLTPFGFKSIEDLKEGSIVNNPDGSISKIIKLHPWMIYDKWVVTFVDGTSLTTTGGHLWNAWRCSKGRKVNNKQVLGEKSAEVIETKGMLDWINRGYNVAIPVCKEQVFNVTNRKPVKLEPYILGLFLGDGCITENMISISSSDAYHIKSLFKEDSYTKRGYNFEFKGIYKKYLIDVFKKLGLYNKKSLTKFIPRQYKYASIKDRYELIQGLLDTDGYVSNDGKLYYTTISKQLAEDVAFIIRSLGGIVSITKKKAGYNKDGVFIPCNDAYELYIKHRTPKKLFKLKRKLVRCKEEKSICKRIKSIEVTKEEFKGRCITVSHPNGLYITNDFTVTHNSWFGCEWLLTMCLKYPGTKWFIGRNELKRLMASTYITFQKVLKWHSVPLNIYKLNGQYNYIEFVNGSRIDLLDLKYLPSDPLYERFGSLEYTSGFIEEAGEINFAAFDVLKGRIGRHLNKEFNIPAKIFLSCNPKRNWLYLKFYKPYVKGLLPKNYAFIQSLYSDNPFTAEDYGKKLQNIDDKANKERLMFGNWDYDDDPNCIFDYDAILDMFTNDFIKPDLNDLHISSDIAMQGRDKFVVCLWKGFVGTFPVVRSKSSGKSVEMDLRSVSEKEGVPRSHTVADSDGLGNYLESYMEGIKTFHGGSSAFDSLKYGNLRSECYFKLAELVNKRLIKLVVTDEKVKQDIIEELSVIKSVAIDDDEKKKHIVKKEDIKKLLNRSPDFSDTLMMGMFFRVVVRDEFGVLGGGEAF